MPPWRIRSLAREGLVSPDRGSRNEYRFDFADLVVLRTARDLIEAGVSFARVRRSLARLQQRLPPGRPLTSMRIIADGSRVIVQEQSATWDAESEQMLLDFRVADLAEEIAPLSRKREEAAARLAEEAADWFEIGCQMEIHSPARAREAYERTLDLDPDHPDAHVNMGRLLHECGEIEAAETHYRRALETRPGDVTALFNLGVALEDQGSLQRAAKYYREAIVGDPDHADAHFNLAGILERTDQQAAALRHLKAYRQLIADRGWDSDDQNS